MNESPNQGELTFEVDARHIRQLGQELVGDRVTAVSELIKNGYDADANVVTVTFVPGPSDASAVALQVYDDGSGMTLEDIKQKWMVISTDTKEAEAKSKMYGRARAGRKGIGRFSAQTLGNTLTISTTVAGSSRRLIVDFQWDAYAAGKRLQDISNSYHYEECEPNEHGTALSIRNVRERWNRADIARVQDSVFLLQPPFSQHEPDAPAPDIDPGFRVEVFWGSSPETGISASAVDDVYAAATAWLTADIDPNGIARARIRSPHLKIDETREHPEQLLSVGPCSFRSAYFVLAREALAPQSSISVERARQLARTYGGIRIYRDHLRVMPYGEPRNDWLGLDDLYRRRGQVLAPIGNINFFGELLLSREENVLIVDTASREGVVENEAFAELKNYLRDTIVWAVGFVASVRKRKPATTSKKRPQKREPSSRREIVRQLNSSVKDLEAAPDDRARDAAIASLKQTVRAVEAEAVASDDTEQDAHTQLMDEVSLLRVLASLGGSVAVFAHEVRAVLSQAYAAVGDLAEDAKGQEHRQALESAEDNLHSLMDLASYLEMYLSDTGRRRRTNLAISNVVTAFVKRIKPLLSRRGIEIETFIEAPHYRTRKMAKSEFEAILFNLLSNAVRAVDQEGRSTKRIRIAVVAEGNQILLSFFDTGVGIPRSDWSRVFDAFYTTSSAEDAELGYGTGLGLTIVADIAATNEGRVGVVSAPDPYATCVQVVLPQSDPA